MYCVSSLHGIILILAVISRMPSCDAYVTCRVLKINSTDPFKQSTNCQKKGNTLECDRYCDGDYACFSLISNKSTGLEVEMKDCWKLSQDKPYDFCKDGYRSCTYFTNEQASNSGMSQPYYHCTCCGEKCNSADLTSEEIINARPPPRVSPTVPADLDDGDVSNVGKEINIIAIVVSVLACILLSLAIVFAFVTRRKSKHNLLAASDRSSVETPQSGDTQSTPIMEKNRVMIPQCDVDLPQLAELKARGRFGCVWRGELPTGENVAVKIFLLQDKESWLNEQDIFATNLIDNHPYILKLMATASRDSGLSKELWLITEFHENGSLADYLFKQTMPLTMALNFMKTMANGLAFLHEDIADYKGDGRRMKPAIAHRDFKSKNVLVKSDMTACIADFGLAIKFIPGQNTGESHGQVGTRRYMAPEVLEGAINFQRDAFLRIDMYAFALVSWEVLTRCSDIPGGPADMYQLPYEAEYGHQPSMEVMTDYVVDQKKRPVIKEEWLENKIIKTVVETIEECWDNDAEARLPAGCVEERFQELLRRCVEDRKLMEIEGETIHQPPIEVVSSIPPPPTSHDPNGFIITSPSPPVMSNSTTMQNLINLQRSQLTTEDEEQALLGREEEEDIV